MKSGDEKFVYDFMQLNNDLIQYAFSVIMFQLVFSPDRLPK